MNLNEISSGDSPVGKVDALDPSSYLKVFMVSLVLLTGFGVARYFFNQVKSSTGVEQIESAVPEV